MRSLFVCLALATPAIGQDALSGTDFDSYATGKTLGYSIVPEPHYGTERYMENCRVIWTTIDGRCTTGVWFESKGQICFRYDDDPAHKCWHFYPDGNDLIGYYRHNTTQPYLIDVINDNDLFQCDRLSS